MIRVLEQLALPLFPALPANSTADDWQTCYFVPQAKLVNGDASPQAGQYHLPEGGTIQGTRLFIMPYAEGAVPATFSMRVWGWKPFGPGRGDGARSLQVPFLLAEFSCTTCNVGGPLSDGPARSLRPLQPSEYLCDTMTLTQGDLGQLGWINATGSQSGLMTNLPGYIMLELQGCLTFQFDFKKQDAASCNAAWCKS